MTGEQESDWDIALENPSREMPTGCPPSEPLCEGRNLVDGRRCKSSGLSQLAGAKTKGEMTGGRWGTRQERKGELREGGREGTDGKDQEQLKTRAWPKLPVPAQPPDLSTDH